jgi:hypothetical protein
MSLGKRTTALLAGSIIGSLAVALGSSSVVAANFHKHVAVEANRGHVAEVQHHWQPRSYAYDEAPYALDHSTWGNAPDNW